MTDSAPPAAPPAPLGKPPTLDDVAGLTPESDYAAFASPQVEARVRNAALKKLFLTDPHFQSGDGLDVAPDLDGEAERSPQLRQRQILLARALGLLDDDLAEQDPPPARPQAGAGGDAGPQDGSP